MMAVYDQYVWLQQGNYEDKNTISHVKTCGTYTHETTYA